MQVKARMASQPQLHTQAPVRGVVVHDQMQVQSGRGLAFDSLQKPDEFPVSVLGIQSPMTAPSSRFKAENNVVVPWRL